jgi:transcriptional regulator with XRE-family HTH domain
MVVKVKDQAPSEKRTVDYAHPSYADQIRELLARAGLTQRQGARELGVDERTMRYWCAGEFDPPLMAMLALGQLAQARRMVQEDPSSKKIKEGDVAITNQTQEKQMKGFGVEISQDGSIGRMTIDTMDGQSLRVTFPRSDLPQMAGTLLKAVASMIGRASSSCLAADQSIEAQTHIPLELDMAPGEGSHVLAIRTTDKSIVRILLPDSIRKQLISLLDTRQPDPAGAVESANSL